MYCGVMNCCSSNVLPVMSFMFSLFLSAFVGWLSGSWMAPWLFILGVACSSLTALVIGLAGVRAVRLKNWKGMYRWRGFFIVAFLHLAQPVVRAFGRLKAWWRLRRKIHRFSARGCVWGPQHMREEWMELMPEVCGKIPTFN